ncbi:MAG: hypothetical protein MSH33_03555 [Fusobacterium necrophorum]|nr:hypothetical protein [Fusobacterium necrophorum]
MAVIECIENPYELDKIKIFFVFIVAIITNFVKYKFKKFKFWGLYNEI